MAGRTQIMDYMDSSRFSSVLSSAILEWLLMLLLFLDGLFAYMVTRFAHFCKLQIPCLLCSRLDHILGNAKPGFYRDLICKAHKSEISSLAYCAVHQKLADAHDMCEGCLLSFDTEKKSNSESCRLLICKPGVHINYFENAQPKLLSTGDGDGQHNSFYGDDVAKVPLLKKGPLSDSSFSRHCSCCSKIRNIPHSITLTQDKSIGVDFAIPISSSTGHNHVHLEDQLSKTKEKSFVSTIDNSRHHDFDRLPHIGYSELKITSDSELSDQDDESALNHGTDDLKEVFMTRSLQPEVVTIIPNNFSTTVSDNKIGEKLIHPAPSVLEPPLPINKCNSDDLSTEKKLQENEIRDVSLDSTIAIEHRMEEHNWSQVETRANASITSEITSQHGPPENLDAKSCTSGCSTVEAPKAAIAIEHRLEEHNGSQVEPRANASITSEITSQHGPPENLDAKSCTSGTSTVEAPKAAIAIEHRLEEHNWSQVEARANASITSEITSQHGPPENLDAKSCTSTVEAPKAATEMNLNGQPTNDPCPSLHVNMDLNDAYKLAVGSKSSLTSPTFTEVVTGRDSSRVHEDLKIMISHISAARGLELPWNDLMSPSPRIYYQSDEFKFSDGSSSTILQNITKRLSIERNESGLESLDGSIVSEIEGESAIDRLRRQIELDRKSMSLLYKELEEERSATAISANQAMAMITRLQEEKAAMQMEALQYQRMMEEQAEYDQEALQELNELLTQREKKIQDLEAEVKRYEKLFKDEPSGHEVLESSGDAEARKNSPTSTPLDTNSRFYSESESANMMSHDSRLTKADLKGSFLDFEDEKMYISESLKKLEKKLHFFSNNSVHVEQSIDDAEDGFPVKTRQDLIRENYEQGNSMIVDDARRNVEYLEETAVGNDLETPHGGDVSEGISRTVDEACSQKNGSQFSTKEVHKITFPCSNSDGMHYSSGSIESDLPILEKELLCLNERLEALEANHNFIEHTVNSLRNGDDGIRFVQEIACHLRELRRIGIVGR